MTTNRKYVDYKPITMTVPIDVDALIVSAIDGPYFWDWALFGELQYYDIRGKRCNPHARPTREISKMLFLVIGHAGVVEFCLTDSVFRYGLETMYKKAHRDIIAAVMTGDIDAENGSVFIQCCVFGDILYS